MVSKKDRIDIAACVGTDTLLGKTMGDAHFPHLLAAILKSPPGSLVYLDFADITNITASYIAATLVRLLHMLASGSLDRHLVIGGVSGEYEDEITYVLEHEHTPILADTNNGNLRVLGPLDEAYVQTLEAVTARGRVTAKDLQSTTRARIGQTAWIKRLTTLYTLGLVKRTKSGREYTYEPITVKEFYG